MISDLVNVPRWFLIAVMVSLGGPMGGREQWNKGVGTGRQGVIDPFLYGG